MKRVIINTIDFFHKPLFSWIPKQTFRYMACGGFSNFLDITIFFISYHFILHEKMVHLPFATVSSYIAAFIMAFCISFPTGFLLAKYITFEESNIKGRIQLFRYFLLVLCCIFLNYIFLKIFVEQFHLYPTVAKILTTCIVISFSYITQKNFTFRVREVTE